MKVLLVKNSLKKECKLGFSVGNLFLGFLWPLIEKQWIIFIFQLVVDCLSLGLSWVIFPFFYNNYCVKKLLSQGYEPIDEDNCKILFNMKLVSSYYMAYFKNKNQIKTEKQDTMDVNNINIPVSTTNNSNNSYSVEKKGDSTQDNDSEQERYIKSFEEIEQYDFNRKLDDVFIQKLRRTKEVDYEKYMHYSGTTQRPSDFVVFDLETTGLSSQRNEIIEIGAIRFVNDEPIEFFHTYIKPKQKISAKITSINGITNEMVESAPSIEEIMPFFIDFIGNDVLIAHNASFDMGFILQNLYNLGYKKIRNKIIDTLKLSRQKLREYDYEKEKGIKLSSYKLESLKYDFGLYDIRSHNALDDCKVCAYVYIKIKREYGDICYIH